MNHSFDVVVAAEYGVFEAIMIQNFQFWIANNMANGRHQHDGRTWTYNSVRAIALQFPYMSDKQARRVLDSLLEKQVIISGNFSEDQRNRSLWYAFHDETKWLPLNVAQSPSDLPKGARTSAQMGKCSNKTDVNTDIKTSCEKKAESHSLAQEILDAYNTILGTTLPKAQVLTSARRAAINARYKDMLNTTDPNGKVRYSNQEEATRWFTSFFRKVLMNPHWIGQNDRGWHANLDWLMNPTNFVKVLEWKIPSKAAA